MDNELAKVFDKIAEKFGIVVDWTQKDVLPYIQDLMQQYRNLEIIQDVIAIIICTLIVISGIFLIKHICKAGNKSVFRDYDNDISVFGLAVIVFYGATLIVCIPISVVTINDMLRWIFVPEAQFLEDISYLLK